MCTDVSFGSKVNIVLGRIGVDSRELASLIQRHEGSSPPLVEHSSSGDGTFQVRNPSY